MLRSDYAKQDVGNLVLLEHVNLTIPDQRLATAFYVTALGLTRDPYMMTGVTNMWINVGRSQIHLPHGDAQLLRGRVGVIVGERDALVARLSAARATLDGTAFGWTEHQDRVEVTCPWGTDTTACFHMRWMPARRGPASTLVSPTFNFKYRRVALTGLPRFINRRSTRQSTCEMSMARDKP